MTVQLVNTTTDTERNRMIEGLETTLARVRSGEIHTLGVFHVNNAGTFTYYVHGTDRLGLLGAISVCQNSVISEYDLG